MRKLINEVQKDPEDENVDIEDKLFLHSIIKFFSSLADFNVKIYNYFYF